MTTQEALQILDQAASMAQLPRQGHLQIQQAVETLKEIITPKTTQPEDPPKTE